MNPGIIASIAAIGVFCLTIGLSYPLLALILEDMGASSGLIGLNAAMGPIPSPSLSLEIGSPVHFCWPAMAPLQ
jgi:hypothetical protein